MTAIKSQSGSTENRAALVLLWQELVVVVAMAARATVSLDRLRSQLRNAGRRGTLLAQDDRLPESFANKYPVPRTDGHLSTGSGLAPSKICWSCLDH